MSSNKSNSNNNTQPELVRSHNRVSLDTSELHRKPKQQKLDDSNNNSSSSVSINLRPDKSHSSNGANINSSSDGSSDDESTDNDTPHPRTDEKEIALIVTKRLTSKKMENVEEAMHSLVVLLNSSVDPAKKDNTDSANRKTAFFQGAHLAAVQAMRRHASSDTIQHRGLSVLVCLCDCNMGWDMTTRTFNPSAEPHIMAVGGLKACLSAMERHDGTSALVQERGCCLIGTLFSLPELRKKIVDKGGLKAVINAMEKNQENAGVQREGCFAIQALLYEESKETKSWELTDGFVNSTWAEAVVTVGSIARVIFAMNTHPGNAHLQMYCCKCFSRLSKTHVAYRDAIIKANGLGSVGQAVHYHKDNEQIKRAARKAFNDISA
jgi:hypothetical protein